MSSGSSEVGSMLSLNQLQDQVRSQDDTNTADEPRGNDRGADERHASDGTRRQRKSYDSEFKLKVTLLAGEIGNREAGRRFGISESNVRRWGDAAQAQWTPSTSVGTRTNERANSVSITIPEPTCANCNASCSSEEDDHEPLTEFTTTDNQSGEERQITVSEAIRIIYEAGLKLNKKSITGSTKITLCFQCISYLAELYRFYVEFMQLTQEASLFQHLISKSVLWKFHKDDSRPSKRKCKDNSQRIDLEQPSKDAVDIKIEEEYASDPNTDNENMNMDNSQSDEDYDFAADYHEWTEKTDKANFSEETSMVTRSRVNGGRNASGKLPTRDTIVDSPLAKSTIVRTEGRKRRTLRASKKKENVKSHKCAKCSKKFKDSKGLSAHLLSQHSIVRHQCPDCDKSFKDRKLLTRHIKFKHGGLNPEELKERTCKICSRMFSIPSHLATHMRSVHPVDKRFPCSACGKMFPTENYVRIHFRQQHREKEFQSPSDAPAKCIHCAAEFKNERLMNSHISRHHSAARHACPHCSKSFKGMKLFRRHLKHKHMEGLDEPPTTYSCSFCPKSFPIPSQLKVHERSVHAAVKSFPCPDCGKLFPARNYVLNHQKRQHPPTPTQYKCEHCDKVYNSASGYQIHVDIVHLNKKDFVCHVCSKRFVRADFLRNHLVTHEEDRTRSFHCPHCDLSFYSDKILKSHLRTHLGSKNLLCSFCGDAFLHAVSLRRHIKVKHSAEQGGAPVESHQCQQCGKQFKLKEYLLQHLRSKTHGGKGHTAEKKRQKEPMSKTTAISSESESLDSDNALTAPLPLGQPQFHPPQPNPPYSSWYNPYPMSMSTCPPHQHGSDSAMLRYQPQ